MSSAFDTINRTKLIEICETILDEDEVRLIRALLSKTSLELYCGPFSKSIPTLIGSPQGDGLNPILFIVYLEAALNDANISGAPPPKANKVTPDKLSDILKVCAIHYRAGLRYSSAVKLSTQNERAKTKICIYQSGIITGITYTQWVKNEIVRL